MTLAQFQFAVEVVRAVLSISPFALAFAIALGAGCGRVLGLVMAGLMVCIGMAKQTIAIEEALIEICKWIMLSE